MLQQFSSQFQLPNEEYEPKEEAVEMGEMTLKLLREPLTKEGSLNIYQRAILAKLCLATIEGKATLIEEFQEDLNLEKTRRAGYITNTVKTFLDSRETSPKLQTATVRCPKNKNRQGFYLKIARSTEDATQPQIEAYAKSAEITGIKQEIRKKLESILAQIKNMDKEEKDTLPMEESARKKVLAEIESIRQAVAEALAITSRGFSEISKNLLGVLLEASEKCEAITRPGIAKIIKDPESEEVIDDKTVRKRIYKLNESLKRSPQTNLALKSQKDPNQRKRCGWYLGLKKEAQPPQAEPSLPVSRRKLKDYQKEMLENLIEREKKRTQPRARREITILEALKSAGRRGLGITPAYCQYVARQLFQKEYPERNFEDKLRKMAEIPEEELGFRIVKTGEDKWEAVLTEKETILQPILAEISDREKRESRKNPEELRLRVKAGIRHLRAQDAEAVQKVFDTLVKNYTADEGLSVAEISEQSGYGNKGLMGIWFRRAQRLNKIIPGLLGFDVKLNKEKYSLTLTSRYTPAEITFSGRSAPLPIGVKQGINFDRETLDKFTTNKRNREMLEQNKCIEDTLKILASYSEKGYAISYTFLGSIFKDLNKGIHGLERLKRLLRRLSNRKKTAVVLTAYKLGTYYLSTPGMAHIIKPVPLPNQKLYQKPQREKPDSAKSDYDLDIPECDSQFGDDENPAELEVLQDLDPGLFEQTGINLATVASPDEHIRSEELPYLQPRQPKKKTADKPDTYEGIPADQTTQLEEFRHTIISIAHQYVNGKTSINDLELLELVILDLDTKKQPPLINAQKNYLAKVRAAIKRADKSTGLVPDYISTQLFSV